MSAWDVPVVPLLFVLSALLSGGGAYLLVEAGAGRPLPPAMVGVGAALVAAAFVVWRRYLAWTSEDSFARAVARSARPARRSSSTGPGYGLPVLLGLLALGAPAAARPLLALAGALLITGQAWAKARLIRVAGQLRPITLTIALSKRRSS